MNPVNRLLVNILSMKLEESTAFYTNHFDFEVDFKSDWFVHLISKGSSLELGIMKPTSEVVPGGITNHPNGFYLTLVVDNVEDIYGALKEANCDILEPPHNTFYGQRRLLVRDINGVVLDVSSPSS